MSFNEKLPAQVKALRDQIKSNNWKISDLREGFHECDCEFCDRGITESIDEDEIDEQILQLEDENKLFVKTIKRLEVYAKDHGIELPKEK